MSTRGFACIGLWQPKDKNNIGSVLRAAACFNAAFVAVEGKRYGHAPTDTTKTSRHRPLIEVSDLKSVLPKDCIPVAVEVPFLEVKAEDLRQIGSSKMRNLAAYTHPERAFYIFGGEDRTLSQELTGWCRDYVFIPSHCCLNLAAAVSVVLYDREAKRLPRALRIIGEEAA